MSPITAWELSIAAQKPPHRDPPRLNGDVSDWFRAAVRATSAKTVPIGQAIAIEAAQVPVATGHRDPGDWFLIATARVRKVSIVTRDAILCRLASESYLEVIVC